MAESENSKSAPTALAIAGSDSGGNAGIQADLLSFAANGVFGTTAITCMTAQNPESISEISPASGDFVRSQIEQVSRYTPPNAIKTGMLFNKEIIDGVAAALDGATIRENTPIVVDPVMVASSGHVLLSDDAISALHYSIFPKATLITPNLDEARILLDRKLETLGDIEKGATDLAKAHGCSVLIKGGHLEGNELHDILQLFEGERERFRQQRIQNIDTHGSGCTLSAAIAANLAKGASLSEAVARARTYLRKGMENPIWLNGRPFINHQAQ